MSRLSRRAFAASAILSVLATACGPLDAPQAAAPPPKPTEPARPTVPVRRASISETVRGIGRVTSASESQLFFRTAGRVRAVHVPPRQAVKKGDLVAELETGERTLQLEIARANVEIADLRAAQAAEAAGDRTVRALHAAYARAAASDHASPATADARRSYEARLAELKSSGGKAADSAVAEKNLEIARLQVRLLEQQIEDTRARAPFDGVLSEVAVRAGDQVQAFAPVGILADPAKVEVTLDVASSDLGKIKTGQPATVTIDAADAKPLAEKVVDVPLATPLVSGAGEARPVRISLTPPASSVSVGLPANVTIVTRQNENALVVPASAVKQFGGRLLVQVVGQDGRRRDVEVVTGITSESDVEVTEGLTEGQTVVAS